MPEHAKNDDDATMVFKAGVKMAANTLQFKRMQDEIEQLQRANKAAWDTIERLQRKNDLAHLKERDRKLADIEEFLDVDKLLNALEW